MKITISARVHDYLIRQVDMIRGHDGLKTRSDLIEYLFERYLHGKLQSEEIKEEIKQAILAVQSESQKEKIKEQHEKRFKEVLAKLKRWHTRKLVQEAINTEHINVGKKIYEHFKAYYRDYMETPLDLPIDYENI